MNAITPRPGSHGHPNRVRYYAGIGSKKTPQAQLDEMESVATVLGNQGWHLRSGFADGADMAFWRGAHDKAVTNFIPWPGFNAAPRNDPRFVVPVFTPHLMSIAEQVHPVWNKLADSVRRLHSRNVCQVLGEDLNTPSLMVVCWTEGGKGGGGTGQAIRIANLYGIPVFDLARESDKDALAEFVENN